MMGKKSNAKDKTISGLPDSTEVKKTDTSKVNKSSTKKEEAAEVNHEEVLKSYFAEKTKPADPNFYKKFVDIFVIRESALNNPNGDPAKDNEPRTIKIRGNNIGLISSDRCKAEVKNRIHHHMNLQNHVEVTEKLDESRYSLYTDIHSPLSKEELSNSFINSKYTDPLKKSRAFASKYIDIRLFGSVFTRSNIGDRSYDNLIPQSLTGPLQVGMAYSILPVNVHTIDIVPATRTTRKEDKKKDSNGEETTSTRSDTFQNTMGNRKIIDHAVYVESITFSPSCAYYTGGTESDLVAFISSKVMGVNETSSKGGSGVIDIYVLVHTSYNRDLSIRKVREIVMPEIVDIEIEPGRSIKGQRIKSRAEIKEKLDIELKKRNIEGRVKLYFYNGSPGELRTDPSLMQELTSDHLSEDDYISYTLPDNYSY